ncbi:SPOR domain-containing protein [Streptomyces sp. BI20]|uniref:SPOR domain-containing protein n=1 Tax=Streptomyces sp. BI20 TaxID=3403460 RepID=UPI003C790AB0
MSDSGATLPWEVIRQDEAGNRYRVGRYATRAEAVTLVEKLDASRDKCTYTVERAPQTSGIGGN